MTRQAGALVGLTAVVSFLLGLVAAGTHPPQRFAPRIGRAASEAPLLQLSTAPAALTPSASSGVDFSAVAERVNAAVVSVDTAFRGTDVPSRFSRRYSTDSPDAPHEETGSGFVIDASGYILTNYHVVSAADRVTITLADGRVLRADIVGIDPALDVALIKVPSTTPLPAVVLGDSDALRVGQWVSAIGNPLGVYAHSMTVGVVSFLGRKLFDDGLDAYIQTDAAITLGSSGGPLINTKGEVIGITTAVVAQGGNIGFAIPIAQVLAVMPQLRQTGLVARGELGATFTSVTPALRRSLDLGPRHGALIQDVLPEMAAERAGLRAYDVVVALDDTPVTSDMQLTHAIASRLPGTPAKLSVWRDGTTKQVSVRLSYRRVSDPARSEFGRLSEPRPAAQLHAPLGIVVRDLDPETAEHLRIPDRIQGALVIEVDPAGPGRLAQVRGGQVILELNRQPVRSEASYRSLAGQLQPGDTAVLLVYDRVSRRRVISQVVVDTHP